MKKVVIYSRFSSDMQDERSIQDQERTCVEYAEKNGWTVVHKFADCGISGASMLNRPEMQKMLQGARSNHFDIVLSEALDRLSRDMEDTANIYKQLQFADVALHTLSEGLVNQMHVGFKGTMNSLFLEELRRKTHRGLQGRALKGKSAGGKSYGYDTVRSLDTSGEPITGERTVNEFEASIVKRIFSEYIRGKSPKKIAFDLNDDGISAPTGGAWGASTIYGNRQRGTGVLNNELYVGRQVWNRQRYVKDPNTSKRVSRPNPESDWVVSEVPDLRIIDQEQWDKVKEYQGVLDKKLKPNQKRRPAHLLSFLLKCGECGGGMSIVSKGRYGCSTSRNKGTCACRVTISQAELEGRVLDALKSRLMDDDLTKVFCQEYVSQQNRMRIERNSSIALNEKELAKVGREMEKAYQAMLDGLDMEFVKEKMTALQARKTEIEGFLDHTEKAPVYIHPNMAQRYEAAVKGLMESLNDPEHRQEAAKTIRALVSEIVLTPNEDASALIVDMKGDLAAILSVADARSKKAMPKAADQMETSERKELEQVETLVLSSVSDCEPCLQSTKGKMVAGARVEHSLGQTKKPTESLANSCKGIMVAGARLGHCFAKMTSMSIAR